MSDQLEQQAREAILSTIIAQTETIKNYSGTAAGDHVRDLAEAYVLLTAEQDEPNPAEQN